MQRGGSRLGGKLGRLVEIITKETQLRVPTGPFLLRRKQVVADVAEELDFHDMDLLHRNARDLGPCLIGVSVIVQI